jgi:hypothetical protein
MKMRKLLPLAILAVVALVALSSCDAMLDAIFSKNSIKVDAWVYAPYTAYPSAYWDYYYNSGSVTVSLSGAASTSQSVNSYSSYDGTYIHYILNFNGLADGTYYPSATFTGYYYGGTTAASTQIYNSSGTATISYSSITMPYTGTYSTDSTGHSLSIVMVP